MAEYLSPGVFIEEIERGPRPIEGVPTSTAAFLGETERGCTRPKLITSYTEYLRHFGTVFDDSKYMPHAVNGFFENGGQRMYVCRIVGQNAQAGFHDFDDFRVAAVGPGTWATRMFVKIGGSSTLQQNGSPVGVMIQVAYWAALPPQGIFDPFGNQELPRPTLTELFDDVVLDDETSSGHFSKQLGPPNQSNSSLIAFARRADAMGFALQPASSVLDQNAADGAAVDAGDYNVDDPVPANRRGLPVLNLDEFREISLVYAPDAPAQVVGAIVAHCEQSRFRFGVFDAPKARGDATSLDPRNDNDTQFAAIYYPWLWTSDALTGSRKLVPPGGHVLGVYVRTDMERGVFKAPANEIVRGVLDLEFDVDDSTQAALNADGVNTIRRFPGRGIRVWGARTLSSNGLWKYVSVRRLFIFLARSIYEGTQWVCSSPTTNGCGRA